MPKNKFAVVRNVIPALVLMGSAPVAASAATLPSPDKIVILIEENRSNTDVYGSPAFPFFNSLVSGAAGVNAASFANYQGITHPSQPNYVALFAGGTLGISDNQVQPSSTFANASNLGAKLLGAGKTFAGYSEDLPSVGSQVETANNGLYVRKHNPWANWTDASIADANRLPESVNRPFAGTGNWPASDFSLLPDVSIVVPNLNNDGHDTSDSTADTWMHNNIGPYINWANTHNSLLMIIWDEDIGTGLQPAAFVGPMVKPGSYSDPVNHYSLLRTIEEMYGLTHDTLNTQNAATINTVWIPEPAAAVLLMLCGLIAAFARPIARPQPAECSRSHQPAERAGE